MNLRGERKTNEELEHAIRKSISRAVTSNGVIDIFGLYLTHSARTDAQADRGRRLMVIASVPRVGLAENQDPGSLEGHGTSYGCAACFRRISADAPGCYSTFCTCSRICSMSTFMSTAARVTSRSWDFEDSVFASRLSSCIKKSSRRPAGSLP